MAYRSLLTILTDAPALAATLDAAAAVARRFDAHLDVFCLGIDRTQAGYYYAGTPAVIQQEAIERAQSDAAALEQAARKKLAAEEVRWSVESAVSQLGSVTALVGSRARFADLVVLPQPYGEGRGQEAEAVVEAALFEGQTPVLILPKGAFNPDFGHKVVLAWNQSSEALSAARKALPLLASADLVNIAVIDPPQHGPERSDPGGPLSQLLARHGARAEVSVLAKTMPRVSDVLIRHVHDQNSDLLVMGAYGHSRFREAILGGATRNMLETADVPVLMAH